MPVNVGPDGRIGIEVLASFHIHQNGTFSRSDNYWLARQPVLHLSKGVPEELMIQLCDRVHRIVSTNKVGKMPRRSH